MSDSSQLVVRGEMQRCWGDMVVCVEVLMVGC